MPQMSYVLASQPAPAPNSAADYVFFKQMFDHIFAQHNADDTIIAAAASAATASTLAIRASDGSIAFTGVGLAPSGAIPGIASLSAAGYTGNHFQFYDSVGLIAALLPSRDIQFTGRLVMGTGSNLLTNAAGLIDAGKIASVSGSALAATAGGTGLISPGASGNLLVSNGTTWASQTLATALAGALTFATIADAKVSPSVSAATVTVAAFGAFVDSAGTEIPATGQQNVGIANAVSATQPPTTSSQYVLISQATGGGIVATGGTVGTSPSVPAMPSGNRALALVLWRGVTANPTNTVIASDITDLRSFGGGGSGSGGGGGAPTTATYLISGTNGSLGSALDVTNSGTSLSIHPALIRRVSSDASFDDVQQHWVQPDIASRLAILSGTSTVTLIASSGSPVTIWNRKITSNLTATASGATGPRYLVFDIATSALLMQITPATSAQVPLENYVWDNASSALQVGTFVDLSPLGTLPSTSISRIYRSPVAGVLKDSGSDSSSLGVGGPAGIPIMGTDTFWVGAACRMTWELRYGFVYVAAGTAPRLTITVYIDSVPQTPAVMRSVSATEQGMIKCLDAEGYVIANPNAAHAVAVSYAVDSGVGSSVVFKGNQMALGLTFWKN